MRRRTCMVMLRLLPWTALLVILAGMTFMLSVGHQLKRYRAELRRTATLPQLRVVEPDSQAQSAMVEDRLRGVPEHRRRADVELHGERYEQARSRRRQRPR